MSTVTAVRILPRALTYIREHPPVGVGACGTTEPLTRDALARRAGVSISAISRYESGERRPSTATAERIAEALGVTVETFALLSA